MYGLRTEVVTNIGSFGSLSDLEKEMRFGNIPNVEIIEYHVFGSPMMLSNLGVYTYDEIKLCL